MKNAIPWIIRIFGILVIMNSCKCPDDVEYRYPEEAIRYYDEHDTVKFYSEETDTYEIFIVCKRVPQHEYEISDDRCEVETHFYSIYYVCRKDSCQSEEHFTISVDPMSKTDIGYSQKYSNSKLDYLWTNYENSTKITVEINNHIYENTISIASQLDDSLVNILYNHEYGVLQRNYSNVTFNLVNDEDN